MNKFTDYLIDNAGLITAVITTAAALATGGIWGFMIGRYDF